MTKKYLAHHGIKGQRWGVRRYQNNDGSLTSAGRKKYNVNEDGTTSMKKGYRRNRNIAGGVKSIIGASLVTKGVVNIATGKNKKKYFSTKSGKISLTSSIASTVLGTVVIASGVKSFINANSNRTFNSTGMGATPESFVGKARTRKQVLASQNRQKNNK